MTSEFGVWARTLDKRSNQTKRALVSFCARLVGAARGVVRRFLRNENVMGMALPHRSPAHENEPGLGAQLFNIPRSAITHAGPQTAHQLIDERRQVALVRHPAFNPFGHELAGLVARLAIPFAGAGAHRADRTHAAIGLEAATLVNDELAGAFKQTRQQTAE